MFGMVDNVWKMTVKKSCQCGEYGSFEHLIFLFYFFGTKTVFEMLMTADVFRLLLL